MTKHHITVKKGETAFISNWFECNSIKLPEGIWEIKKNGETIICISRIA